MSSRGRKPDLTEKMRNTICTYVRMGLSYKEAATLCGITERTIMNWLEKGRAAREDETVEFGESTDKYILFSQEIEKAKLFLKQIAIKSVIEDIPHNSKLGLEVLSRKFPGEWGRKDWPSLQQNTLVLNDSGVRKKDGSVDTDAIRERIAQYRSKYEHIESITDADSTPRSVGEPTGTEGEVE